MHTQQTSCKAQPLADSAALLGCKCAAALNQQERAAAQVAPTGGVPQDVAMLCLAFVCRLTALLQTNSGTDGSKGVSCKNCDRLAQQPEGQSTFCNTLFSNEKTNCKGCFGLAQYLLNDCDCRPYNQVCL
jgi:hypothetical protein